MNHHHPKNTTIICDKLQKKFRVKPSFCFGFRHFGKFEYVTLSEYSYAEFVFFAGCAPVYYFYALDSKLEGTSLQKWINARGKGVLIEDRIIDLLKQCGISGVSSRQCRGGIRCLYGKSYVKEFSLLEIRDVEFG